MDQDQELRYLRIANRQLQEENNGLRRRLRENSRHAARINQAFEDALLLANVHLGYIRPTREEMMNRGLSRRRWQNARALAILGRVWNFGRFTSGDLVYIEACLERARKTAIESPEAFRVRLPKHGIS